MTFISVIVGISVVATVLILGLEFLMRSLPSYKLARKLPGPDPRTIYGTIQFIRDMNAEKAFAMLREYATTYQQTYAIFASVRVVLQVVRAKEAEIVLASSKHTQKGLVYEILTPFMGDGLLNSSGKKWQQRRRILTPAFHFSILQQFLAVFKDEGHKLVQLLRKDSDGNTPTELGAIASRYTLNAISETSMGVKLDQMDGSDEYRERVCGMGDLILERFLKPWLHNRKIYNWSDLSHRMDQKLKPVHEFTRNVIKKRRQLLVDKPQQQPEQSCADDNVFEPRKRRYAMLDTLLGAESRGEIDAEGIREEVDTFMFEGHDTTATGLVFIFFLLGQHKEVQQRVYEEIKSLVEETEDRDLVTADFNRLTYTDRVIKECLRLYPPVPLISRDLTEDFQLSSGQLIPKGTQVNVHIYDMHRDPDQFPNPESFDPDRFLPEESAKRHPFAYVPFSAGMRNCIGQKYAMLEMKSCLLDVLINYQIEPVTKPEEIVFYLDLVLRTKNPVKVQFLKRKNTSL